MANSTWEYAEASDRLLGDDPGTFADHVSELSSVPEGALFLRHDQQRLELCWRNQLAVVGHSESDELGLDCAVTELSIEGTGSIPTADLLDWNCSCCGVGLGRFKSVMHIPRDVAFEVFKRVLSRGGRPNTCADGPIIWTALEVD
jgi:hypothetical protein